MKGLNQAGEQHGFDGEGFAYLRSSTWWGGIITSARIRNRWHGRVLTRSSGTRRDRKLRSIRLRARYSGDAAGCAQCVDWVSSGGMQQKIGWD